MLAPRPILNRGFTLTELVLVVMVVAILAASAFSRLPAPTLTLAAEADEVASTIRLAQSLEFTHGASYCFNIASTTYQVTTSACTTAVPNLGTGSATVALTPGVTATSNLPNGYLAFFGAGVPYASQTQVLTTPAVITLSNATQSRTVSVAPQTGTVSIQ